MHTSFADSFEQHAAAPASAEYALAFRYFLLHLGAAMLMDGQAESHCPSDVLRSCADGQELDLSTAVRPSGPVLLHFERLCERGCCRYREAVDANESADQWHGFVAAARVFLSPAATAAELARCAAEQTRREAEKQRIEAEWQRLQLEGEKRQEAAGIAEWRTILEKGHLSSPALTKQEYLRDVLLKTSTLPGIVTLEQRQWAYERALQVFHGISQGAGIPAWADSGLCDAVAASREGGLLRMCYLRFCDYNELLALRGKEQDWEHSDSPLASPGWTQLSLALLAFADEPVQG